MQRQLLIAPSCGRHEIWTTNQTFMDNNKTKIDIRLSPSPPPYLCPPTTPPPKLKQTCKNRPTPPPGQQNDHDRQRDANNHRATHKSGAPANGSPLSTKQRKRNNMFGAATTVLLIGALLAGLNHQHQATAKPTSSTSNKDDPPGPDVAISFRQIGYTSTQAGTLHVAFRADLQALLTALETERRDLGNSAIFYYKWDGNNTFVNKFLGQAIGSYDEMINQVRTMANFGSKVAPSHNRHKKAIGALVAAAFGVYSYHQLSLMQNRLEDINAKQADLFLLADKTISRLDAQAEEIEHIKSTIDNLDMHLRKRMHIHQWTTLVALRIQDRQREIQDFSDLITAASMNRLSPKAVLTDAFDLLFTVMGNRAATYGYDLMITEKIHLFQLEATAIMHPNGQLAIILHVPVSRPEGKLKLFQLAPLPFPIRDDLWLTFAPEHDVIAVNEDSNRFRTMTKEELGACKHFEDTFHCDNGNVALFADAATTFDPKGVCVRHLYNRSMAAAQRDCPKQISKPYNQAVQINAHTFLIYTTASRYVDINCINTDTEQNQHRRREINMPRTMLTLEPGCRASVANTLEVTAAPDFERDDESFSFSWAEKPEQLLEGLDADTYTAARDKEHLHVPTDVTEARIWTDQYKLSTNPQWADKNMASQLRQDVEEIRNTAKALPLTQASAEALRIDLATMKAQSEANSVLTSNLSHRLDDLFRQTREQQLQAQTRNAKENEKWKDSMDDILNRNRETKSNQEYLATVTKGSTIAVIALVLLLLTILVFIGRWAHRRFTTIQAATAGLQMSTRAMAGHTRAALQGAVSKSIEALHNLTTPYAQAHYHDAVGHFRPRRHSTGSDGSRYGTRQENLPLYPHLPLPTPPVPAKRDHDEQRM